MSRAGLAAVLICIAGRIAAASPPANLRLEHAPSPRHLTMRTATAPQPEPQPQPEPSSTPATVAPAVVETTAAPRATDFDLGGVRKASEKVVFRLDLGFGVDGGAVSGRRSLAGVPLSTDDYREVRAQGFGNLFVGTRGLVVEPLSSYLSLGFRLTPHIQEIAPLADSLDRTRDLQIRAGWAEAANFLPGKLLHSVRVRAGRQYSYGPWPIHFDGTVVAWTSKPLQISTLAGVLVDDYLATVEDGRAPPVAAVIAALDLGAMGRWPITVRGTVMRLQGRRFGDLELGYRPRRGLVVVAGARAIDDHLARERASVRAQVSEVTHIAFEFEHRHAVDWRWDPSFVAQTDPGAARPYLELDPTLAQIRLAIRAGTVLLDNIDLYARAALAIDLDSRPDETTGFAEVGGAFEVRARRWFALTGSAMVRDYELTNSPVVGTLQTDVGNLPQPIIDPTDPLQRSSMGEESFQEGGVGGRISTGARRFSANTEVYGRRTRYAHLYDEDTPDVGDQLDRSDVRYGARFSLDGWMSPRLRLHLEYDLSSSLDRAPEINGWKVLRALAEGSF